MDDVLISAGLQLLLFLASAGFILYLISKMSFVVRFIASNKKNSWGLVILAIVLGVLIILSSKYGFDVNGAKINVRDSIAIFSAVVGGPIVGIFVSIVGAAYRLYIGGWTAIPCSLATLFAGLIAVLFVYYKKVTPANINSRQIWSFILFAGLWEIIHLLIFVPLLGAKPLVEGFNIMVTQFVVPMMIFNMILLAVFLLIMKDSIQTYIKLKKLR